MICGILKFEINGEIEREMEREEKILGKGPLLETFRPDRNFHYG